MKFRLMLLIVVMTATFVGAQSGPPNPLPDIPLTPVPPMTKDQYQQWMQSIPLNEHTDDDAVKGKVGAVGDAIGDAPNAHKCSKDATILMRLANSRLKGLDEDEAKKALPNPDDPDIDDMVDKVYKHHPQPQSSTDAFAIQWEESMKCGRKYGLVP